MTFLGALQLAFAIEGDIQELSVVGVPTEPIRIGNEWFTVTQVEAPGSGGGPSAPPSDPPTIP